MDKSKATLVKSHAYVDGRWVGDPVLPVTNKATGEVIAHVPDMTAKDANSAIAAASSAFPAWSQMLAKQRAAILRKWFDLIIENQAELAEILVQEQGKPLSEAEGEIAYGASFVEFYAEQAKRIRGETIPQFKTGTRIVVIKQPVGVVAAITPWNFPHAMITRKVAPALAAGCTVVIKPAEETPLSALALAELAERAGLPSGVLNVITAAQPEDIGLELTTNPDVRMITFTGSTKVGRLLMAQASGTIKKVALELGGNAPFIVFDDADIGAAIDGLMQSKFRNAGQTCVSANRIFVQSAIFETFAKRLCAKVEALKVGPGSEPGVEIGPLINSAALAKVERHLDDATTGGATVLTGGARHALGGTFFEPTVLTGVGHDMLCATEETFGPVAPLFKFETEADVIAQANATHHGLAGYFYTRDLSRAWRVAEALEFGLVAINEGALSSEVSPFGGIKQSGLGHEGSHHGIEEFVELKYILMGGI